MELLSFLFFFVFSLFWWFVFRFLHLNRYELVGTASRQITYSEYKKSIAAEQLTAKGNDPVSSKIHTTLLLLNSVCGLVDGHYNNF